MNSFLRILYNSRQMLLFAAAFLALAGTHESRPSAIGRSRVLNQLQQDVLNQQLPGVQPSVTCLRGGSTGAKCDVILIGCGVPKRGMGWYHAKQLLDGDVSSAHLTTVIEPWFLGQGADSPPGKVCMHAHSLEHHTCDSFATPKFSPRLPCHLVWHSPAHHLILLMLWAGVCGVGNRDGGRARHQVHKLAQRCQNLGALPPCSLGSECLDARRSLHARASGAGLFTRLAATRAPGTTTHAGGTDPQAAVPTLTQGPTMALISGRTADNPRLLKQVRPAATTP